MAEELARLEQRSIELENERNQLAEELEQLRQHQAKTAEEVERLTQELNSQSEQSAELATLRDQQGSELEELRSLLEASNNELDQLNNEVEETAEQRAEAERECQRLADQIEKLNQSQQQFDHQREQLSGDADRVRQELQQLTGERDGLASELETTRAQLQDSRDSQAQLETQIREQLVDSQAGQLELEQQIESLNSHVQSLEAACEQANNLLAEKQQAIDALQGTAEQTRSEHEQLLGELNHRLEESERKCELALSDVHKLKKVNAELNEQLDQRPEQDAQESPELVSLRAERDALAERVVELENVAAVPVDADDQQELADLQRRFEMAVEDLRSLKQENESLKTQLDSQPESTPAPPADGGALDWQAQKERLLQELAAEDGVPITPQRKEERATIEGTISITDRVVAEKERELDELRRQLSAQPVSTGPSEVDLTAIREEAMRAAHEELFNKDEVIQAERARLADLEQEWKEKLRKAELEISVQRAEIAREKAKLEEKMSFMEAQKSDEASPDKPRRRWLSALGIKDDDEEDS